MKQYTQVFEMIQKERLKLKVTKYSFGKSKVKPFGHVFDETSFKVESYKIKEILEAPRPSSVV